MGRNSKSGMQSIPFPAPWLSYTQSPRLPAHRSRYKDNLLCKITFFKSKTTHCKGNTILRSFTCIQLVGKFKTCLLIMFFVLLLAFFLPKNEKCSNFKISSGSTNKWNAVGCAVRVFVRWKLVNVCLNPCPLPLCEKHWSLCFLIELTRKSGAETALLHGDQYIKTYLESVFLLHRMTDQRFFKRFLVLYI